MSRTLALVGGGHAHVEFIRRWRLDPLPDTRLCVFDPNPRPVYSGMVPGFVAGQYRRDEVEIDLKALCAGAGAERIESAVTRIDATANELETADGARCRFDLASLDIGSTVAGLDTPGVQEFALPSRPIARLVSEIEGLVSRLQHATHEAAPVQIVGGGAAGVELAFCLRARTAESPTEIEIVTGDETILPAAARAPRARVERALERRGIRVRTGSAVVALYANAVELESGQRLASSGALWVTGPASLPLARTSSLPADDRGFVRIRPTLQVEGYDDLFAVGDCASLPGLAKAGVYAVRTGPLIDHNLRSRLHGTKLREYIPQRDFLSLLNLGDGTAIGTKWGVALEGRWLMWLKDRIDRTFMERYK